MISKPKVFSVIKTVLLFIILPALCVICYLLYAEWQDAAKLAKNLKDRRENVVEKIAVDAKIIARKIDKDSLRHATIAADENEYTNTDLHKTANILDTTALAIGILKKQIRELTVIATTSQAQKLKAYALLDSQKRVTYMYRDKFLTLAYRPAPVPADSVDFGEFDFAYNDSLTVTQYQKRNWFLGQKKSYIDIYSNDPRTTVNGVKRLTVKQDSPAFGLRAQGMATFNLNNQNLLIGPAIRFDFGRFSIQGARLYEPTFNEKPVNVLGLTYDALRL